MRFDLAAELTGLGSRTQLLAVPSVSSTPVGVLELKVTDGCRNFLGSRLPGSNLVEKTNSWRLKKNKNKNTHKLKDENDILLPGFTEDHSLAHNLSDCSKGLFQRRTGGAGLWAFAEKKNVVEHQNITANHTQKTDLKLMILVLFYVWEYSGVWAH